MKEELNMSPVSAMVTPVASHVSVLRQSTVLMEEPPEESDLSLDEIKEEIVEVSSMYCHWDHVEEALGG